MPFIFPFPFLYASTDYRFKYFFSFLKRNQADIVADVPYRINPHAQLPIFLITNNADKHPFELLKVRISIRHKDSNYFLDVSVPLADSIVQKKFWWISHCISDPLPFGWLMVDVHFSIKQNKKIFEYKNDNYRFTSKKSFTVFHSAHPLPASNSFIYGDIQVHSSYTDDQVEFGAPLEVYSITARSIGLDFFAVTDHSYDLDDSVSSFLKNDPTKPKWTLLMNEIESLNSASAMAPRIILGEEVSAGNFRGKNIHLLLLEPKKFVEGMGDGGEAWFKTTPDHSIAESISISDSALAIASHPFEYVPKLHSLLLARDTWSLKDLRDNPLDGLQIFNGMDVSSIQLALEAWTQLLLEGKKMFVFAGTDAHGNLNRFRQVKVPFWRVAEEDKQQFGVHRTVIPRPEGLSVDYLAAMKAGRHSITTGPLIKVKARHDNQYYYSGDSIQSTNAVLDVESFSTPEFGELAEIIIFKGIIGDKTEIVEHIRREFNTSFHDSFKINLTFNQAGYVRCFVKTKPNGTYKRDSFVALTNPLWLFPSA